MTGAAKTVLRPVEPGDAPLFARYCADAALARMTGSIPHPYGLREAEAFCESAQKPDKRVWAIEDENGPIGTAGYRTEGAVADIGYWIGAPFTGRGHATRAARLLIERAFAEPQIERLTACVFQDNPASARVLLKAGMDQRADCRGESLARGPGTYPTWTFVLFREEWRNPVLETHRLMLRPAMTADSGSLVRLLGDIEVARMLARVPHPYREDHAREWLGGAHREPGDSDWVIDAGDDQIGAIGLKSMGDGAPELGFWLGRPFWRQGLMSEALGAVLDWAFGRRGLTAIVSGAFADNAASQRLHEKFGFTETGRSTRYCLARDETLAHVDYALTRTA